MLPVVAVLAFVLDPAEVPPDRSDTLRLEIVRPFLPGKNRVRWWAFDWRWTELEPASGGAPVRLYFYDQARPVAERANAQVEQAYAGLSRALDHRPTRKVPVLLYNSHLEFQSTQAFDITEHVLGVTDVRDLTLALPYWGEHRRFQQVLTHELGHVFTIDMVVDRARRAEAGCNPLQAMPLWFIEGFAQHLSLPGLTPEVRAVLTDARLRGKLPAYLDEGPFDFDRIYVIGHAQVNFLDDEIGAGTARRVLESSSQLCGRGPFSTTDSFPAYLSAVTGVPAAQLQQRWLAWVDRIVAPARAAPHPRGSARVLPGFEDVDSYDVAPDGRTVLYRATDRDSAVGHLAIRDLFVDDGARLITRDQRMGLTSLHPLGRRVTAIAADRLAYVGLVNDSDVIFVRAWSREGGTDRPRFKLGPVVRHDVSRLCEEARKKDGGGGPCDGKGDLIEAGHPAFDPRTGALVFVGLSRRTGVLDVFQLDHPMSEDDPGFRRLTDDVYAEQSPRVLPDGRLVYASDATADGRYEIAVLEDGRPVPLTDFEGDVDAAAPAPDGEGGVVFQAHETGWMQAYRLRDGEITRITGVPTSWEEPVVARDGSLTGLLREGGRVRLVTLPREKLLAEPVAATPAEVPPAWAIPRSPIAKDVRYGAFSHLRLESAFAAASTGPALVGGALFTDLLNDVLIGIGARFYGELDQSELDLLYLDRTRRLAYGGIGFVQSALQLEPGERNPFRTFLLQRAGVGVILEYPLERFIRVSASVSPQAVRAHDFTVARGAFARETEGAYPAVATGAAVALDTTRSTIIGSYQGVGASLRAEGTIPVGSLGPFGSVRLELQGFQNLIAGYPRLFLRGRLAGGTAGGETLAEQFYLPAALNLRAYREGELALYAEHYYLAQLELSFPLSPIIAGMLWVQGLVGAEVGGTAFGDENPFDERIGAGLLGASLGFGPLVLDLLFARPVDVGGVGVPDRWNFHLIFGTPFGVF